MYNSLIVLGTLSGTILVILTMLTIKYFRWTESRAFYKKWEQYWCKLPDQMDKLLFTCIKKKLS